MICIPTNYLIMWYKLNILHMSDAKILGNIVTAIQIRLAHINFKTSWIYHKYTYLRYKL